MTLPFVVPGKEDPRWTRRGGLHVRKSEGIAKWASGDTYIIKVAATQTNGSLGFVESSVPPGGGPLAHAHTHQDEAFYLLSGELEFLNGDQKFIAEPGDFVFIPRGNRHRFKNVGTRHAHMLFLFTPGGPEQVWLEEGGADDVRPGEEPPPWGPERYERIVELTEPYGVVYLPEDS